MIMMVIYYSTLMIYYSTILYIAFNLCKVQSMDDNCGEWVECMGVASGCGEQEVGVASGSGWNLWVWLLGVVLRRYIDFLILFIPTPLVSVLFAAASLLFCSFFKNVFRSCTIPITQISMKSTKVQTLGTI